MRLLVLLGDKEEYLDCLKFKNEEDLDTFLESIEKLMVANISKELPLRERLKLAPRYFSFAGAVTSFEVINPDEMKNEQL